MQSVYENFYDAFPARITSPFLTKMPQCEKNMQPSCMIGKLICLRIRNHFGGTRLTGPDAIVIQEPRAVIPFLL
jgi:hypothetical protein